MVKVIGRLKGGLMGLLINVWCSLSIITTIVAILMLIILIIIRKQ
jgi:hypothetical protein